MNNHCSHLSSYQKLLVLCKEYGMILFWDKNEDLWRIGVGDGVCYEELTSVSTMSLAYTPWEVLEKRIAGKVIESTFEGR